VKIIAGKNPEGDFLDIFDVALHHSLDPGGTKEYHEVLSGYPVVPPACESVAMSTQKPSRSARGWRGRVRAQCTWLNLKPCWFMLNDTARRLFNVVV